MKNTVSELLSLEEILNLPSIDDGSHLNKTFIYFLIKENSIIYIGCSVNIYNRLNGHKKKDYDQVRLLETYKDLKELEGRYIFNFLPKYNKNVSCKYSINFNSIKDLTLLGNINLTIKLLNGTPYIDIRELNSLGFDIEIKFERRESIIGTKWTKKYIKIINL